MILKLTYCVLLLGSLLLSTLPARAHTDDYFNWQTLESGMVRVHWYEGDAKFGQAALKAAQAGLDAIGRYLPSRLEQPVEIFIYATPEDLRRELAAGSESWAAGHADPALGLVRVVVPPGSEQAMAMEQRIPHELMHVMLYRHIGAGYQNIPAWLREGMATLAELYPNAEYERALADAAAGNLLIPLKDLCVSFPADTGQAFLAYAEARSFTTYLHDTYGSAGLLNLAASYAGDLDCERGMERALGAPLSSLESRWRFTVLGQNTARVTLENISPYLALLCLVLVIPLIGIVITLQKKGNHNESGTRIKK